MSGSRLDTLLVDGTARRQSALTRMLLATTAITGLATTPSLAQSLPTGASVAYGTVGFQRSSGTLTINQGSQNAIVNYNSFSIGRGNTVNINQPNASSAILNRVTGNTPSTIAGHLNANGQVYLVNPNGIAITKSGVVNVGGGFVASSLGMSDEEFRGSRRRFTGNGSSARVSNQGTITVGRGGYAALIGGTVKNGGMIAVPMGKVGLGSGELVTLDVSGDGFLQVALPTGAKGKGALISNSGTIAAEGGTVMLDAATARAAARNAINISGTIDAHSISGHNGSIVLGGGDGGAVRVSGTLNVGGGSHHAGGSVVATGRTVKVTGTIQASGRTGGTIKLAATDGTTITGTVKAVGHHGKGGAITVTGMKIAFAGATVDASGTSGGGTVKIGGDLHGGGTLAHAGTVTIDANSVIRADATKTGDGGSVVVWSDLSTAFAGTITARGGAEGNQETNNGGTTEVSSKGVLAYTGLTDLTAAKGAFGTLLLDPYNVTISTGTGTSGFTASSKDSVINVGTLQTALANANVTVSTGSNGNQAGNITVASALGWSSGSLLTLTAANSIAINAPITISGAGRLALNSATTMVGSSTQPLLSFGTGASVSYTGAEGSGQALTINGTAYTLVYTVGELDAIDGASAVNNAAITRYGPGLAGSYALANDIFATNTGTTAGTPNTYGYALVAPGTSNALPTPFSGRLEGLGHTVNSAVYRTNQQTAYTGLLGFSTGTIRDIGVVGGLIDVFQVAGGLAGFNGGIIQNSYATGNVTTVQIAGGLVGLNAGLIDNSHATGVVKTSQTAGGLVGSDNPQASSAGITNNTATISNSYATGTVTASTTGAGGLVGQIETGTITGSYATGNVNNLFTQEGGLVGNSVGSTISNSYATGNVTGGIYGGGLVGLAQPGQTGQPNLITASYATGTVNASGVGGGLVGGNLNANGRTNATGTSAIRGSYATGIVTSASDGSGDFGGLVGQNASVITDSFASGPLVANVTLTNLGGLVGENTASGSVSSSYSTGAVAVAGNTIGGSVGLNNGAITNVFFDNTTSGRTATVGSGAGTATNAGGLSTATLQNGTLPTGFGPLAWGVGMNLYPYLKGINPNGVQAISGTVYKDVAGTIPAASVPAGAVVVSLDAGGGRLTTAATGANGYYYGFVPAGMLTAGENILATTPAKAAVGTGASATLTTSSGLASQRNVNLYPILTVATSSLLLSSAPTQSDALAMAASTAGTDVTSAAVSRATTGMGYVATGASFTIDQTYDSAGLAVRTIAPGAPIVVAAPLTLENGGNLTLMAAGSLRVDAPITAKGAVTVALAYDTNTTTPAITDFGFAQGSALTYANADGSAATGPVAGQALTVNGTSYTLVYNMAELDGIDGTSASATAAPQYGPGLGGAYAIATPLNAAGTTYTNSIVAPGTTNSLVAPFYGTLEGLGQTISGLTIVGSAFGTGLIGELGLGGTARDIGLVGGSLSGARYTGGLVGLDQGMITQAYATGAVSGSLYVGGLVGYSSGGTITQAYATGAVNGSQLVGGLVGYNEGTISQAYATGAVSGGIAVGGLVGLNQGTISQAYATGAVSGSTDVGGLVGLTSGGLTTASAFDTSTTGQTVGLGGGSPQTGVTALSTTQLQSTTTNNPFGTGSTFAGGAAGGQTGVYPYLTRFFPNGVQAVSGLAYKDGGTTLLTSPASTTTIATTRPGLVAVVAGGQPLGTATTGANGYYYVFSPAGTVAAGAGVVAYTVADTVAAMTLGGLAGSGAQNAASFVQSPGTATNTNLPVYGTWLSQQAGTLTSLSTLNTAYATAIGATAPSGFTLANREIDAPGAFTLDAATNQSGTLALTSSGAVTQTAAGTITAANLLLSDAAGSYILTAANSVATIAANAAGAVNFNDTTNLTIGAVANNAGMSTAGVKAGAAATLVSSGSITIGSGAPVSAAGLVVLAATGAFVNQAGANAVTAGSRWLVYSSGPGADTFGPTTNAYLNSGNTAVYGTPAGGAVNVSGNRYVFASPATLTVTTTNDTKTYGMDVTARVAGDYTVTGLQPGVAGAYLADTAATAYSGAPTVTSAGSAATAGVANSPYMISAAQGSLASQTGYTFAFANAGTLTVNPLAVTVTGTRVYDGTTNAPGAGLTVTDAVNGDTVTLSGTGVLASKNTGAEALTSTNEALTGLMVSNANYTVTGGSGTVTVTAATLTYDASAARRTYGAANPALSGTITGFVGADNQANATMGTVTFATAATASSNVGSYAINGSGLTANNNNYVFAQAASNATTLTINPAPLIVSGMKTYDTTTVFATGQLAVTGGVNGEMVSLTSDTGTTASANAGTYAGSTLANLAISVSGGNAMASNYALPTTGTLTISRATVAVAGATGVDKTYDATTALPKGATGFTFAGVYNSDAANVSVTAQSAAYASPNVGPEAVNVTKLMLGGSGAGNYMLSATAVTGSGTISPAVVPTSPATIPTIDASATDLASTAERALLEVEGHPIDALPFLFSLSGDSGLASETYASRLVRGLGDPRFESIIVCVKDVCTLVPPREQKKVSQLEISPR